jgi:hypothetical protein
MACKAAGQTSSRSLASSPTSSLRGLCLKSPKSRLETVSTVRGSGWVAVPKCEIAIDYEYDRFTHPLPRTVLTVSKRDVLSFEARPPGCHGLVPWRLTFEAT